MKKWWENFPALFPYISSKNIAGHNVYITNIKFVIKKNKPVGVNKCKMLIVTESRVDVYLMINKFKKLFVCFLDVMNIF